MCGGTLIDSTTIVTAAHCFFRTEKGTSTKAIGVEVILGAHNRTDHRVEKEFYDGVDMKSVMIHTGYDEKDDIALVFLNEKVSWSEFPNIRPACLPHSHSTQEEYVGKYAVATGWGYVDEDGPPSDVLQEVKVMVYSSAMCVNSYKLSRKRRLLDSSTICAGTLRGGHDTCYGREDNKKLFFQRRIYSGDSGGPLVVKNKTFEAYEVIGLTKGGEGCGARNRPGLYTSIVTYLPWIKKNRDQYSSLANQQQLEEEQIPSHIIKTSFSGPNSTTGHLWPDGEVPLRIESSFSPEQLKNITSALEDISAAVPCIHFRFRLGYC